MLNKSFPGKYEVFINKSGESMCQIVAKNGSSDCPPPGNSELTKRIVLSDGTAICVNPALKNIETLFGKPIVKTTIDADDIKRIQQIVSIMENVGEIYNDNVAEILNIIHKDNTMKALRAFATKSKNPLANKIMANIDENNGMTYHVLPGMYEFLKESDFFGRVFNVKDMLRFYHGTDDINAEIEKMTKLDGSGYLDGYNKKNQTPSKMLYRRN